MRQLPKSIPLILASLFRRPTGVVPFIAAIIPTLSLTRPSCDVVLIYFNFSANGLSEGVWNRASNSQIPVLKKRPPRLTRHGGTPVLERPRPLPKPC
jgi:hypothetical protein